MSVGISIHRLLPFHPVGKGDRLPDAGREQAAVGPRGSGGTLNLRYSAGEMLKAPVPSEGRINVLLWYRLVGAYVGLLWMVLPE